MKYKAPMVDNKPQWVPIVCKNKDFLVGYVAALQFVENVLLEPLNDAGIHVDTRALDLCLDSSRFNDTLENGKRERDCTKKEIEEYFDEMVQKKKDLLEDEHPENDDSLFGNSFLTVECLCGLGIYNFNTYEEVPETTLKCGICGKTLIDYTGYDDDKFDYDGIERTDEYDD